MDLGDLGLTSILIEVEHRTGYSISGHRAEIFGLCPTCQATPPG
jgi:Fe2+ or Zn2+ uptake regulation protein